MKENGNGISTGQHPPLPNYTGTYFGMLRFKRRQYLTANLAEKGLKQKEGYAEACRLALIAEISDEIRIQLNALRNCIDDVSKVLRRKLDTHQKQRARSIR
jgi:hypothetical protein